jgi:hypothetical protein
MNSEYSKVNWPFLKEWKKNYNKYLINDKNSISTMISTSIKQFKNREISYNDLLVRRFVTFIVLKKYKNYYIDSIELSNFLLETKFKKEILSNIDNIVKNNYSYKSDENNLDFFNKDTYIFSGCIHSKSFKRSIFFSITVYEDENTAPDIHLSDGDIISGCPLSEKQLKMDMTEGEEYKDKTFELLNFALNLIFYMDAFPENILNKPPDEVCDKLNFNNSKTISLSNDIAEYLHENRDVSPHLRRGHFRYLNSEYYKEKRFKSVFVKSSFVKGTAKTVI